MDRTCCVVTVDELESVVYGYGYTYDYFERSSSIYIRNYKLQSMVGIEAKKIYPDGITAYKISLPLGASSLEELMITLSLEAITDA
jgi:hypothetical protein